MGNGNDLRFISDLLGRISHIQFAVSGQFDILHSSFFAQGQLLPGDQVTMVLHHGDHDLIALVDVLLAVRGRHQVEPISTALGKDHLVS